MKLNIIEICKKQDKNGRRKFKAVLHEVFPNECIGEDGLGVMYQDNGITWIEEYCNKALPTISGMSIRVQFLDDERTQIYGHGETDLTGEKVEGLPLFENATVVGHFEKGYITDIEDNGVTKRVCIGEGILDEMCYPNFVHWLEEQIASGDSVFGSIEIFKTSGNEGIVYLNGHKGDDIGRVPMDFMYSGFAMLDCCVPADKSSKLLELNQKMEVETMNEEMMNQINEAVKSSISASMDKSSEFEAKISELNSIVEKKDEEITTLNKNIADLTTALETIKSEQDSYWAERDAIERELGELKAAKRIAELNDALAQFTEEETKVAEENICKFKDDPINSGIEINSIVEAIKVNCYDVQKKAEIEAKEIAEINSKKDKGIEVDSIFGGMDVPADVDTNAINMDNLFA
jgi:hypothetical protein